MNNSVAAADLHLSKRRVVLRLTTLAWAVLVFYLSTERFGSDFSQGLVAQALTLLHISVSPRTFHILDTLLRKIAHMTEYGILAFFVYGSFAEQQPFRWRLRQARDENRFTMSRTGEMGIQSSPSLLLGKGLEGFAGFVTNWTGFPSRRDERKMVHSGSQKGYPGSIHSGELQCVAISRPKLRLLGLRWRSKKPSTLLGSAPW